jgi:hypothetical protein
VFKSFQVIILSFPRIAATFFSFQRRKIKTEEPDIKGICNMRSLSCSWWRGKSLKNSSGTFPIQREPKRGFGKWRQESHPAPDPILSTLAFQASTHDRSDGGGQGAHYEREKTLDIMYGRRA